MGQQKERVWPLWAVVAACAILTGSVTANVRMYGIALQKRARTAGTDEWSSTTLPQLGHGGSAVGRFVTPTVLYVFSPTCSSCAEDFNRLAAVQRELGTGVTVALLAVDSGRAEAEKYVQGSRLADTLIVLDEHMPNQHVATLIARWPQLIVVAAGGAVKGSLGGRPTGVTAATIRRMLK